MPNLFGAFVLGLGGALLFGLLGMLLALPIGSLMYAPPAPRSPLGPIWMVVGAFWGAFFGFFAGVLLALLRPDRGKT